MTLAAVAATMLVLAVAVAPACADRYDDGNPTGSDYVCENYEICFTYLWSETTDLKQFWYSANHDRVACCVTAHVAYFFHPGGQRVMDNAQKLRNRDSSCTVYVWDIDGFGNWYVYAEQHRQASYYIVWIDDRNNGHSRCNNQWAPDAE